MSIAGKILARVLLDRLNEHLEQSGLLPESQCGFRKDRGTIDMIFTARQLQEKCQEQNVDLYGDNGIPIRYRFDGKLFNLRRLQAKSKMQTEVQDELLFADDMAKGAPAEEKMQKGVDQLSDSCDSYDLTISIKN